MQFSDTNSVALYSHWGGSELPAVLAKGLSDGAGRLGDPSYLTRILFSRMVEGDLLSETGYGIEPFTTGTSAYCEASPDDDLFVNPGTGAVTVGGKTFTREEFLEEHLES